MTNRELDIAAADAGLEGVVAAKTAISRIDGQNGRLFYQGIEINELVEHSTFEETVYLLWHGTLPTRAQLDELHAQLKAQRHIPDELVDIMRRLPPEYTTPMEALRTATSALASYDPDSSSVTHEHLVQRAIRLTAAFPTIVAAWNRIRSGQDPLQPRDDLDHAANFLYLLCGEVPNERAAKVLDVALILHADHGLNASTFSARVTASTHADMYSAITAAICSLKGPRHGGANEQVMRMLDEVKSPDRAEAFVQESLSKKRLIMGFGHRVYRADDPRALQLRRIAREVGEANGNLRPYEISEAIAAAMEVAKPNLPINVDFFSASTYNALGIPTDQFTPIFAISRVAGWAGHVIESFTNNTRILRPESVYIGPEDQVYIPIDQRG